MKSQRGIAAVIAVCLAITAPALVTRNGVSVVLQNWYFEQGNPQEIVEVSVNVELRLEDDESILRTEYYNYSCTIDQVPSRAEQLAQDAEGAIETVAGGGLGYATGSALSAWITSNVPTLSSGWARGLSKVATVSPYVGAILFGAGAFA
jgi:hypothetical protein